MVFLIQNTQNRDSQAIHAKLDELIIKLEAADNQVVVAEDLPDEELQELMERQKERAVDEAAEERSTDNKDRTTGVGKTPARA
jgi:low affinity Fe/Cu permease